jgi:hypothetical protein
MLNLCGIVAAILKMATTRNCSMSGINSGHHNPCEVVPLRVDFFKMAVVAMEMAKMLKN